MRGDFMRTWHTMMNPTDSLQILQFGYEPVGERAKWGPGRRNQYILHYVLEGKGYYNGTLVTKGQGFLIRPMESTHYYPDTTEPWRYLWVCFSGDDAQKICNDHITTDENGIFTCKSEAVDILHTLQNNTPLIGQMLALSLFYRMISWHETPKTTAKNRYVDGAVEYMNQNFHRPLSVAEVAKSQNVDDRYLYNLFVKHLGISPKQYLNDLRLNTAKQLLDTGNCSITEVAVSVGFSDVLAFSRFFTKHAKMSPTAYQKQAQQFDI